MTDILELEGMEFFARHGCSEKERADGNVFTVDFMAETECGEEEDDDLASHIDLARVYEVIALQVETPSNLIETVAHRIVRALEAEFPQIGHFSIRLSKKNPPLPGAGKASWSRVTVDGGACVRLR